MKNLVSDIDIYCINLKDRIDRRLFMARQFKDLSVIKRSTFIEAVSAIKLTPKEIVDGLSKEESACLLSHIKAIKAFASSDSEFAIILEDDCDLQNSKKFYPPIADAAKTLNFKNLIIQLAVSSRVEQELTKTIKKRTFWNFSTIAYLLDKEYAKNFLQKFKDLDSINKYTSEKVLDPRTEEYFLPANTAETILYYQNAYSMPALTSKILGSSLNHKNADEAFLQEQLSIKKTNALWSAEENIDLFKYLKKIDNE
jgi:GR25 family glycosyltransferase involved in LPS biosynthesis